MREAGARRAPRRAARPPAARESPAPVPLRHPAVLTAVLVVAACIATTVTSRMWDTDFWQHLVVGREIWRSGAVPNLQLWTWPTHGQYDVTPSWGFRALLWPFWERGGLAGAYLYRWLTTLGAFALLWAAARRMGARGLAPLVLAAWAALVYRQRSQLRPETLVAVLLALQLWIHESRRNPRADGGPGRDLTAALPLVALAWANVHISYWMGLALQAIYWLDAWWSARRGGRRAPLGRLAWIGLASGAASFLNPAGWRALAQPFEYFLFWRHEPIYRIIGELRPVYWSANLRNGLPLLLLLGAALLLWRLRRRGFDLAQLAIVLLFVPLALATQRFIGFVALLAVPFVGRDLDAWMRSRAWPRWTEPAWVRAGIAAFAAIALSIPEWRNPTESVGIGIRGEWYPVAACDYMERAGVRGRGFNAFYLGGYLLWRFFPEADRLPFMDIHQAGTREDRRLYALATTRPDAWAALDGRHRFDWVMLNRYRVEDDRMLEIVDADPAFALVFMDDNAALYVRRAGAMAPLAARDAFAILGASRASAPRLMRAARDPAERPRLLAEIDRVRAASPYHAVAASLEANLALAAGDAATAYERLGECLAIDPDFAFANERRSLAALSLGRPREAIETARREWALQGRTPRLERLIADARTLDRALEARRRAVRAELGRGGAGGALRDTLASLDRRLAGAPRIPRVAFPPVVGR